MTSLVAILVVLMMGLGLALMAAARATRRF
jgi:hypothetical protein